MKFYVSGKIGYEHFPQQAMQSLVDAGHEITLNWTELPNLKPYAENIRESALAAVAERSAVVDADVYVLLAHPNGVGMYIELGMALGLLRPVRIVTTDEYRSIFFCHPLVKVVDSIDDVILEFS